MHWAEHDPRDMEWRRFHRFLLEGEEALVKVTPMHPLFIDGESKYFPGDRNDPKFATRPTGYVTQQRYLFGKSPTQIETTLGLMPFQLKRGCKVFKLARAPRNDEYLFRGGADRPGGGAYDHAAAVEARERFRNERTLEVTPYWPPGDAGIPQWQIMAMIPLVLLTNLTPGSTYPNAPL